LTKFTLILFGLLIYGAVTLRMAGGGLKAYLLNKKGATDDKGKDLKGIMPIGLTWVPELLFCLPFGYLPYKVTEYILNGLGHSELHVTLFSALASIVSVGISYIFLQSGPGGALHWGENPKRSFERKNKLRPLVFFLAEKANIKVGSVQYCRLYMGVRGFFISLPAGGLVFTALMPLGYELGHRLKPKFKQVYGNKKGSLMSEAAREYFAGVGGAISVAVANFVMFLVAGLI